MSGFFFLLSIMSAVSREFAIRLYRIVGLNDTFFGPVFQHFRLTIRPCPVPPRGRVRGKSGFGDRQRS